MNDAELKRIIEALLMSSSKPLSLKNLLEVFEDWNQPSPEQLKKVIDSLQEDYQTSALELKSLASGYVFQTKARYSPWIARLQIEKPAKYSKAFLETLAIIAYKQPVTRADIEDIRGVSVNSQIMKTLLELDWITEAGVRDVPGKPREYKTTPHFLDHFNLNNIKELPLLPDMMTVFVDNEQTKQTECESNEQ